MECPIESVDSTATITSATTQHRRDYGVNLFSGRNHIKRGSSIENGEVSAVCIRNLCKSYKGCSVPVVQNFSMNVKKGSIYGLLGSSGCGKTTILSCIVGLRNWDSGSLFVFGRKPGSKDSGIPGKKLGYMPQELALYNQLSILEVIQFYGRIYNMSNTAIVEQWGFLTGLLDLPRSFKLVGELSGGQKRRASLALALIHSPELLVLDEPTVGLDPLLRKSIWNHLFKIVNTLGTTIIITTHYIEEARHADTIGIMRNGRLLVEERPSNLLQIYNCHLLEQVVLQLCRKDERTLKSRSSLEVDTSQDDNMEDVFRSRWNKNILASSSSSAGHSVLRKSVSFDAEDEIFHDFSENSIDHKDETDNDQDSIKRGIMSRIKSTRIYQALRKIYGLITVILLTFIRYPAFLIFLLFVPSIQASITLYAFGSKPRDMPLGIVNHDLANWTVGCDMQQHSGMSCDLTALSCKYINKLKLDDLIILKSFDTEEEALRQVQLGNTWGYLHFPHNYSQHMIDFAAAKRFAFDETITGTRIRIQLDFSQYVASFFMIKHLYNSYKAYVDQLITACDFGGRELDVPILFRPPVYGTNADDYTSFTMPGVIISSISGIACVLTALLFIADRKQGTLSRAHAAGLTIYEVMASHLITQGIVTIAQIIIWNGVLHFVFRFQVAGSEWLCLLFCILVGVCGAGVGLLLGVNAHDEVTALIVGVFLVPLFLLFGGVFYPLESMSKFWRYVGYVTPVCWPTLGLRSVVVRGLGLTHALVWPGIAVICVYTIGANICTLITYKKYFK